MQVIYKTDRLVDLPLTQNIHVASGFIENDDLGLLVKAPASKIPQSIGGIAGFDSCAHGVFRR